MEDNLRFDSAVRPALLAVAMLALLAAIFQVFLRYEYIPRGPVLWRIDRVTSQACRVDGARVDCVATPPSTSTSPSMSLSTSTSTTVRRFRGKSGR